MIDEFVIVRDGTEVATVSRDGTATAGVYTDSGLIPGRQYGYQVRCRDSSTGNTSAPSPVVNVTTDTIPTPTVYQFRYPFGTRNAMWVTRLYSDFATFAQNDEFSEFDTEHAAFESAEAADFLLDWAGSRNVSDLYVLSNAHDGNFYPSAFGEFPALQGTFGAYHGMEYLLDGAEARGMKIWAAYHTMRYSLEPSWITAESAGNPDYSRFMDPDIADVRTFVIDRAEEFFNNYGSHPALAGMCLDYIRRGDDPGVGATAQIALNQANFTTIVQGIKPFAVAAGKKLCAWTSGGGLFNRQGNISFKWADDGDIDHVILGFYSIPANWTTEKIASQYGLYAVDDWDLNQITDKSKVELMASADDRSTPGFPIVSNADIDRQLAWVHIASNPASAVSMYQSHQWPAATLEHIYGPDGIYADDPDKTIERIWARDGLTDLCHIRYSNNSEVPAAVVNGGIEITANTMAGLCAQPSGTTWRMAILFRPDWSSTETLSADPVIMSRHVAPVDETVSLTWGRLGYRWVITGYENGNPFGHSAVLSHDAGDVLGILVNVGPSGSNITVRNYTKGTESFGNRPGAITFRKKAMCRVGALEGFSSNTVPFTWLGVQQGPAAALWEPPLSSSTAGVLTE